jgi:hypothetical protein
VQNFVYISVAYFPISFSGEIFTQNEKKKLMFLGHIFYSDFDFMAIFLEQFLVIYSLENFRLVWYSLAPNTGL